MQALEATETLNPPGSETLEPKPLAPMPEELQLGLGLEAAVAIGDFVWGKIKSSQWWPGRVCDPSEASDHAKKSPRKDQSSVLVAYFGDDSFAWCNPSQLKPFAENFDQMASSSCSKSFRAALDSAVSEIGKCLEVQLSCSCLPEEERSGIVKFLGKSGKISNFSVDEFLGVVRDVAVDVMAVNGLGMAMLHSWVGAFERGLGVGHRRKAIAELVDKIDLDVPAAEEGKEEGEEEGQVSAGGVSKGPDISAEKSNRGRKKKSMAVLIAQMDLDSVEVSEDEEEKNEENVNAAAAGVEEEVGSGRRERKKSKYLSPPYTDLSGGFARTLLSPKSLEAKTHSEGLRKEEEEEMSNALFQVNGFDTADVLSEFLTTAVNPLHLKRNRSAKIVRGLFAEFRSSVYTGGAKFDAYQKQLAEYADNKIANKEVGDKSEEGKKSEGKRGKKRKDIANGEGEILIDKSEEGMKKRGRKRKDIVEGEGETPINKSEEGKKTEAKRGRKKKDKVNGEGETPRYVNDQTSEHSDKKEKAASNRNIMKEGANGKTPVTPKRQTAIVSDDGTSGRKRGRKKADLSSGTVNNVELGKSGQEQINGEEVANTKTPTVLDAEGCSQMKQATLGQKRKSSKDGPVIDVPVNLGSEVINGSGEGKSRKKKKKNKNSTCHEDPAAILLTFSPGISLPSKEDLISAFTKYGPVIRSHAELLKESSSAKVVFERSSDAEKAVTDKVAALGLPVASYRLRYLKGNLSSPSSQTPIPVPKPPLPYIRKSLERMISTLSGSPLEKVVGTSEGLKPETRDNLVGEMQGLLMKVDKMLTGPTAGTST